MEVLSAGDSCRKRSDIRNGGEGGDLEINRRSDKDPRASYRIDSAVVRLGISGNRDIYVIFVVIFRRRDRIAIPCGNRGISVIAGFLHCDFLDCADHLVRRGILDGFVFPNQGKIFLIYRREPDGKLDVGVRANAPFIIQLLGSLLSLRNSAPK